MAAMTSQTFAQAGTTPVPITPTASDTILRAQFGPNGCVLRIITTGTPSNVTVADPGVTPSNNPGTATAVAAPATGSRMVKIPLAAIGSNDQAIVTSSSQTGMTYELYAY